MDTPEWLYHVITDRANIELIFNDPWWSYLDFSTYYSFEVLVFNVNPLFRGFHPSEFEKRPGRFDDPYEFAAKKDLSMNSLEDYLNMIDQMFREARAAGAVCLKMTMAYRRTLHFEEIDRSRVEGIFGRPRSELSQKQVKVFQDFLMWQLVGLSEKYDLPFQIHTGLGQLEGSNPILLMNLIESNPKTKFILFHGGFPWVGESGVIVMSMMMKRSRNVWLDSVWLPTLSYTLAKRAFHEWLEIMPSDRIMWGGDCNHAEGIYGAAQTTRRCLAEVLSEKVERGQLQEEQARTIGRQILRENALTLFPRIKERLWKHKGRLSPPPEQKFK